jgi:hypothetical protein
LPPRPPHRRLPLGGWSQLLGPLFLLLLGQHAVFRSSSDGAAVLLLLGVRAEKDSNPYPWGSNPNNRYRMYWRDARNVLQDLDSDFAALYVVHHGCVWSECSVDQYDDDGENRDGDEYWYQYRTEAFCANAAYSLYGMLKDGPPNLQPWNACRRSTYINSFFTYGGADTVLEALGLTAATVFDDFNGGGNNDNKRDGGDAADHPNAVCYVVEGEEGGGGNSKDNDSGGSSSVSGMSSTMGCSDNGKSFVAANFRGETCDGNHYLNDFDALDKYNRVFRTHVNCKQIWKSSRWSRTSSTGSSRNRKNRALFSNNGTTSAATRNERGEGDEKHDYYYEEEETRPFRALGQQQQQGDDDANANSGSNYLYSTYSSSPAELLLASSWACDIALYPAGCPDPYGLKRKYDRVLRSVSHGQSVRAALIQQHLRFPILLLAWCALAVAVAAHSAAYCIHRKPKFKSHGVGPTLWSDFKRGVARACLSLGRCCTGFRGVLSGEVRKRRKLRRLRNKLSRRGGGRHGSKTGDDADTVDEANGGDGDACYRDLGSPASSGSSRWSRSSRSNSTPKGGRRRQQRGGDGTESSSGSKRRSKSTGRGKRMSSRRNSSTASDDGSTLV